MRVIAGEAKGRTLVVAKGGGTRSATDRIRETLFAILADRVEDARVLDLFAGAGTLGIEALSRGATRVTFVERAPEAIAALRRNLATTGFEDRAEVVRAGVLSYLERIEGTFDVIFLDPPFAEVALLGRVLAHERLRSAARAGLLVARAFRKRPPVVPPSLRIARERVLGEESLLLLEYV